MTRAIYVHGMSITRWERRHNCYIGQKTEERTKSNCQKIECDIVTEYNQIIGYNIIKEQRKGDFEMSVLKINKSNFENEIMKSEKLVLLDFYADWCGPCRMMSPLVDEIAEENPQYLVGKINVSEEPELAQSFGVTSIPTLAVMKNGKVVGQSAGARPKAQILSMLEG